jgi:hypothetical protein
MTQIARRWSKAIRPLEAARGATGGAEGIAGEAAALGEWVAAPLQLAATTAARAISGIVKRLPTGRLLH